MKQPDDTGPLPPGRLLESVTRLLRHEVGDLLQTIYSTVAILQQRIPLDARMEQRFLTDLRGRAETCKDELDAVHDLVLPITLKKSTTDLTELIEGLVSSFRARYKSLDVRADSNGPLPIAVDAARILQVLRLLMTGACQSARNTVIVRGRNATNPDGVELSIIDDGHGASPEQLEWLTRAFATTHQAICGLGLALAKRVVELHGGQVIADNRPAEGLSVRLILPRQAPEPRS
jgi:signal transduction histidine kinase